jgi:hypothetical protein
MNGVMSCLLRALTSPVITRPERGIPIHSGFQWAQTRKDWSMKMQEHHEGEWEKTQQISGKALGALGHDG